MSLQEEVGKQEKNLKFFEKKKQFREKKSPTKPILKLNVGTNNVDTVENGRFKPFQTFPYLQPMNV